MACGDTHVPAPQLSEPRGGRPGAEQRGGPAAPGSRRGASRASACDAPQGAAKQAGSPRAVLGQTQAEMALRISGLPPDLGRRENVGQGEGGDALPQFQERPWPQGSATPRRVGWGRVVGVHRPKPPSPKRPFGGRSCWRLGRTPPIPEIRRTPVPERSRFPSSVSGNRNSNKNLRRMK